MNSYSLVFILTLATTAFLGQTHAHCCNTPPAPGPAPVGPGRNSLLSAIDRIDMQQDCDNLDYMVSISVTGTHLGLAAIPNQVSQECPILFVHDSDGKQIEALANPSSLEKIPQYEIGSFSLDTIFDAFDGAEDSSGEAYDLMTNNCATLVISMMDGLDVPITMDHIAFVAENLFDEDNENWINLTLRNHHLFSILFPRGELTPDLGLMYEFVAEYVESHQYN